MNTKTARPGRPAAKLIYPEGTFTIHQLFALNKRKVKWELSIRQHLDRAIAKRWVSKEKDTLQTGSVGKPAHLFHVTKWGMKSLTVKSSKTETPAVETEAPVAPPTPAIEIPLTPIAEAPVTVAAPAPVVETPVALTTTVVDATLAALTPVS